MDKVRAVAVGHGARFPVQVNAFVKGSEDNRSHSPTVSCSTTRAIASSAGCPATWTPCCGRRSGPLVAGAGREKWSPSLEGIVKDLKAGKPPATILPRVAALRNSTGEAGEDAKALLASMTAAGRKKLDEANEKKASEPLEAFLLIEKAPAAYKGSPLATEVNELLSKLKADKAVRAELAARPVLEVVKKLDVQWGSGPTTRKSRNGRRPTRSR